MSTDERHHVLAQAILKAAWGETNGKTIWQIWTPEQRDEAAAVVAPILPALERVIERYVA